jgi:hypothetical protein
MGSGGTVKAVLKALHLEALLVRKFRDPLERLLSVDGELPQAHRQRSFCAQALVDRSFYVGQLLPRSSRLQLRCIGRDNALYRKFVEGFG